MTTSWETTIGETLIRVFGGNEVLGIVGILIMSILIVALRPPTAVAFTAVGLTILIIGGSLIFGGMNTLPMLWFGIAFGVALIIYYAYRRISGG
jgi:hypothetical protein